MRTKEGIRVLSKEWLLLSADMEYACLRIVPGLTNPISESDIQTLLLASNCRRYQPLTEGIKQAISLLNTLLSNPTAPLPGNPVPIAQRHDASVLLVVEKDRMSATAQITADVETGRRMLAARKFTAAAGPMVPVGPEP